MAFQEKKCYRTNARGRERAKKRDGHKKKKFKLAVMFCERKICAVRNKMIVSIISFVDKAKSSEGKKKGEKIISVLLCCASK